MSFIVDTDLNHQVRQQPETKLRHTTERRGLSDRGCDNIRCRDCNSGEPKALDRLDLSHWFRFKSSGSERIGVGRL
ncbi:hypothetical protein V6N13_106528 [Hibiscus sabdariffa]|uniref:Uncharacterized protein n=1 Tax=Hibiscus sabdariffa TaxID=183260 RepID=A0ABR2F0Z3_9ROSI